MLCQFNWSVEREEACVERLEVRTRRVSNRAAGAGARPRFAFGCSASCRRPPLVFSYSTGA